MANNFRGYFFCRTLQVCLSYVLEHQSNYGQSVLLLMFRSSLFFFFAAQSPRSLGRSPPDFATCSTVTKIYEIRSDIWEPLSPEIWRPKNMKFGHNFRQLCDLITIICRKQQDIVSRKTLLQTTDTPTHANLIWLALVHKRLGPEFLPTHRPQFRGLALTSQQHSIGGDTDPPNRQPLRWALPHIQLWLYFLSYRQP